MHGRLELPYEKAFIESNVYMNNAGLQQIWVNLVLVIWNLTIILACLSFHTIQRTQDDLKQPKAAQVLYISAVFLHWTDRKQKS